MDPVPAAAGEDVLVPVHGGDPARVTPHRPNSQQQCLWLNWVKSRRRIQWSTIVVVQSNIWQVIKKKAHWSSDIDIPAHK